ncbi:hypothetical protein Goklo_016884 [Gossypium klotzschianum]|uniref:Uncharacterized protein n=1 Tax=Gossypium klotzschianum TaxID=34286 RepID=A0A7J8UGA5_9ROSI|nr:hypothetical protein [Gossypium klotzschianum]
MKMFLPFIMALLYSSIPQMVSSQMFHSSLNPLRTPCPKSCSISTHLLVSSRML